MPFRSLRARLLVAVGALVVCLTGATLTYVGWLAGQAVADRLTADLLRSRDVLTAAGQARYDRLALVARLLASFPQLMALMGTDAATVRDFLADYRERNARNELLLAFDASGAVVARSDTFAPLTVPDARTAWLEPALSGQPVFGLVVVDGRPHHMALVPAEAGGTVFGFVAAAAPIDDRWAATLRDASGREMAVLTGEGLAGTTLGPGRVPWRTAADVPAGTAVVDLDLDGERFEAVDVGDPHAPALAVVALQSVDLALAPYRNIQRGLGLLGLLAAAGGIAAAAMLARSITAPVAALSAATRAVAQGRFDVTLPVTGQDELAQLSQAFNSMTAGLRERADMQKFVSQGTVDMIQRAAGRLDPHSGTRQEVTLLFCDIRGFTAFAEHLPPEDAVALLNGELQRQAEVIARFHGDVDKFLGDGVFAHFTGPDKALDAIRCAVDLHRARAAGGDALAALGVGVGIATGEVIVGSVGSARRLDYTAVGAAVNLAARLCAVAEPGETLINETTFAAVRGLVAAEPAPPITVKGFSEPVRAFRMRAS
ncbi:MAG: adenylate/guanylate cyclase domain-containing protein [Vicinamibacterales bacterium]